MDVILLQRVEKLGHLGQVVSVKPGYARNFLLPKKIALRATKENIADFEQQKEGLVALNLKHKEEAEILAKRIEGQMAIVLRQASEGGQLYGSVTSRDVALALNEPKVTRAHIHIPHPIKTLGIHGISVKLHPEVATFVSVNVAKTEDEAKAQAATFNAANKVAEETTTEEATA